MSARKKFGPLKKPTKTTLKKLTESPGVYSLNGPNGKILYIGKAKQNRPDERIGEHLVADKIPFEKFGFIPTTTQVEALKLEKKLIKQRKPKYNKQGK